MIGVGDVLSVVELLQLDALDSQWVSELWGTGFTSCPDYLPDAYEDRFSIINPSDSVEILTQCQTIISGWLSEDAPSRRSNASNAGVSWASLQEVPHKPLVALLYFYIKKSTQELRNKQLFELAICAARCYFSFLRIPGSAVYNVFQVSIFETCMELFNVCSVLTKLNGDQRAKQGRRNHAMESDDEGDEEVQEWSLSEQQSAVKMLNELMVSFGQFVGSFSFKSHQEALKITLKTLGEMTRLERLASVEVFVSITDKCSLTLLAKHSYEMMHKMCDEVHGLVPEIVRLLIFSLIPNFSLIGGSSYPEVSAWPPREQAGVRALAVWFLKTHIMPLGKDAHMALKILVQQLCLSAPDRAEPRTKTCELVIAIISLLPQEIYFAVLKWVLRETMSPSASQRVVGIELISKLIYLKQGSVERSNMPESDHTDIPDTSRTLGQSQEEPSHPSGSQEDSANQSDANSHSTIDRGGENSSIGSCESLILRSNPARLVSFCKPVEYVPIEFRRVMLAILVDRMRDVAATVRVRAFNALNEIVCNRTSPTVQFLVNSLFISPYAGFNEIDFNQAENEFLKWPSFFALLEEAHDPVKSKSLLPGGTRIVSMILKYCMEEGVFVRKAALMLLTRIFKLDHKWMTSANLELLVKHCRDPSVMVRKEMVGAVTELMLHYPDDPRLTQMWVEEVVPQVADRDLKVQEYALGVLTTTILSNIKTLERTHSAMDVLPWQLLTHIANLRLRSFLSVACEMWKVGKSELSPGRVSAILSHIGGPHDAAAWVMLVSLTDHCDIPRPEMVADYYLNVVAQNLGDAATDNLVLITLSNVWHTLDAARQASLQTQLLDSLKLRTTRPALVPLVVAQAAVLMVSRAPDEMQGKKDVAIWAKDTVSDCEEHLEPCLDASNENRGCCEICIYHLTLMSSVADMHPDRISHATFELIHSFVMSKISSRDRQLLTAKVVSVQVLARMALRDGYLASRLVSGLSALISNYTDPVLLSNIVVAVADIGKRFTSLIEPLVPALSLCLKNPNRSVSEMTLLLTIDLLQEDYLKPRGAFIYHLLMMMTLPSPRAATMVKFYFINCMLPRHAQNVEQLLLIGMFHYTRYRWHPVFLPLDMEPGEEKEFNIDGDENHHKRLAIYKFIVGSLTSLFRARCMFHVCTVILNGAADKLIDPRKKEGEQLLLDAFALLSCKEIRLDDAEVTRRGNGDDDGGGGGDGDGLEHDQPAAAKKKDDDKKKKRKDAYDQRVHILETYIPICLKLKKTFFNMRKRKLTKKLYFFVRELVRDYKSDIKDFFRDDMQFGEEILHEINTIPRGQDIDDEPESPRVSGAQKRKSDEFIEREGRRKKHNKGEIFERNQTSSLSDSVAASASHEQMDNQNEEGEIAGEEDRQCIDPVSERVVILNQQLPDEAPVPLVDFCNQNLAHGGDHIVTRKTRPEADNLNEIHDIISSMNKVKVTKEKTKKPAPVVPDMGSELSDQENRRLSGGSSERSSSSIEEDSPIHPPEISVRRSVRGSRVIYEENDGNDADSRVTLREKAVRTTNVKEKKSKVVPRASKKHADSLQHKTQVSQERTSIERGTRSSRRTKETRPPEERVEVDSEEELECGLVMPPPLLAPRLSKKSLATPTGSRAKPLMSSTPLLLNTTPMMSQRGFDDLSPVVQSNNATPASQVE